MHVFSFLKKSSLLCLFGTALIFGSYNCIVEPIDKGLNGLACGKKGECSQNYKCYVVADQGPRCLIDGKGSPLFVPSEGTTDASETTKEAQVPDTTEVAKEADTTEKVVETTKEDPPKEVVPEPKAEPAQPDDSPKEVVEKVGEPTPDTQTQDSTPKDAKQ